MQPSDKGPFAELLANVMSYYNRESSPFLLGVFWDALRRHEFEDVQRAFNLHAQDPDRGQFAPKVADLTRLLEGSTTTQGMRAWVKVAMAMRSVGAYRSVTFDDPLIHVVIAEMGGWIPLCRGMDEEMPFKARDFERRYASYRLRRELPAYTPRLIGENEAENKLNGRKYEVQPVLVGDPRRAQQVLERGSNQPALPVTDVRYLAQSALATLAPPAPGGVT